MPTRRQSLSLALAAGLTPPAVRAQTAAQAWRAERPIRMIVPFAPGGSNDIVGRIIAEPASRALGQPIVVENRAGAGSVIGAEIVARAPPDGYTVLINSSHSTVPAIVARMPYRAVEDFVGVAVAGFSPHVLVVDPRLPARTAPELVALLKANPGRYNLATAGIGSGVHLAGELLRTIAQVPIEVVHYRGGGPSVAALIGGEAQVGTPTMASSIGQIRGGQLRALAVLAESAQPGAARGAERAGGRPARADPRGVLPHPRPRRHAGARGGRAGRRLPGRDRAERRAARRDGRGRAAGGLRDAPSR